MLTHWSYVFLALTRQYVFSFSAQPGIAGDLRRCTKSLYDACQQSLPVTSQQSLPELIIADFDDEQVWQELELHSGPSMDGLMASVARLAVGKPCGFDLAVEAVADEGYNEDDDDDDEDMEGGDEDEEEVLDEEGGEEEEDEEEDSDLENDPLLPKIGDGEESDEEKELEALLDKATGEGDDEGISEDDDDSDINFDFETKEKTKVKPFKSDTKKVDEVSGSVKKRKTVVDDTFFKMADMEQFLDAEDEKEERRRNREEAGGEQSESEEDDEESGSETEVCYVFENLQSHISFKFAKNCSNSSELSSNGVNMLPCGKPVICRIMEVRLSTVLLLGFATSKS